MDYMVNQQQQQPNFKHFCRVCKKGFMCGRALGGHMRAHGIGDENGHMDEDDSPSDWEDKNAPPGSRRMYALRTNPNRQKSIRVCENCGKEFFSWKSFLEHGKCNFDGIDSPLSSPSSDGDDDDGARRGVGWSKRKRSLRLQVGNNDSSCPLSEEEDLANCLMMLSNATVDTAYLAEPEESCASASREDHERRNHQSFVAPGSYRAPIDHKAKGVARGLFECKACKKVFNSHQALGGHRASHKKVKGCFASRLDQHYHDRDSPLDDEDVTITHEQFLLPSKSISTLQYQHNPTTSQIASKRKSKVHECSICHRIFSSGQALGGHKRCHWITSNAQDTTSSLAKFQPFHDHQMEQGFHENPTLVEKSEPLDLNKPVTANEVGKVRRDPQNTLSFEVSTNDKDDHNNDDDTIKNIPIKDEGDNIKNINNCDVLMQNVDDNQEDSKVVELARLSDLKDMNMSGGSSPWLQVGIGSTTVLGTDP